MAVLAPLRTVSVLVVHLLLASFCRGQFKLIGPTQPVVARVSDDIILPCHLEPAVDVGAKTLEWTRPDLKPRFVFVWRAGQDLVNIKNPSYEGRTSLLIGELKHGNILLKLSKVKTSDEGRYKCYIPEMNTDSTVELVVVAVSSPVISLSGIDQSSGRVVLQCESTGWYPEPEVFWLDGEGNLLSAGPTETVRGPDDLYTVSSRVTVEKRHSNSFTCRVQQNHINQIREAHIHVPDSFFDQSNFFTILGLAVVLAFILALSILLSLLYVRRRKKTKTKNSHSDETDQGEKSHSRGAKGEEQISTEEEQPMMQESVQMQDPSVQSASVPSAPVQSSCFSIKWPLVTRQRFKDEQQKLKEEQQKLKEEQQKLKEEQQKLKEEQQKLKEEKQKSKEEQQSREEAENRVQILEEELQKLKEELQKLKAEQQRREKAENKVQIMEKELQKSKKEKQKLKKEQQTLKEELQKLKEELQEKTREFQAEKEKDVVAEKE